MMRTLKSGLTIGMLVTALAMTGGCGDNDNSGNGNDNDTPNPTRTATPSAPVATSTPGAATPTPAPTATGGTTVNVGFDVTSSAGVQGFDLRVAYPIAKGSFTGTGENVACTTTASGSFIKNDTDASGILTLIVANASNLTLPITISCTFDESGTLTTSDLTVTVREVTQNGAPGDVSVLTVATSVS